VDARRALVDRVPALDLVAEHVDVVVQGLRRRVRRGIRERDRFVDPLDRGRIELLRLAVAERFVARTFPSVRQHM